MTVASEYVPASLDWTGVETSFAAGFSAQEVGDVVVKARSTAIGAPVVPLINGIHYTVELGDNNAVTVLPKAALPAAPQTILISRFTPDIQETDFKNLESFDPEVHTQLHDAAAMRDGEIRYGEELNANEIADLRALIGSLPGFGTSEVEIFASLGAASLINQSLTKGQVYAARGDSLDVALPSPAILERVGDAPIVGFTDPLGQDFEYRNKKIELQLCGTVEGDHHKNTIAHERARQHAIDHGGALLIAAPYDVELEDQLVFDAGRTVYSGHPGGRDICRVFGRHSQAVFLFGAPTARNLRTDPDDRTQFYGLWHCSIGLSDDAVRGTQAAFRLVNLRHFLHAYSYVNTPARGVFGENGVFPGDGLGINNSVHRARTWMVHYDGQPTDTHCDVYHSGSEHLLDHYMMNGANAPGKYAQYYACVNANWDASHYGTNVTSSQWDIFFRMEGNGGGTMYFSDGMVFDRCIVAGFSFDIGDTEIIQNINIGNVHAIGQLGGTDYDNVGVDVTLHGSGRIVLMRVGGFWRQFGGPAVKVRRIGAGTGALDHLDVDIEAYNVGRYNGGGIESVVDIDNIDTAKVAILATTDSGEDAYKSALKLGTSVGAFADAGIKSKSHTGKKINIPAMQNGWTFQGINQPPTKEYLLANRTYYVRADGNDANDGLSDTAAGAFRQVQACINYIQQNIDFNGFVITIQMRAGTYAGFNIYGNFRGDTQPLPLVIIGDTVTPGNVIISATSDHCIDIRYGARLWLQGVKLTTTTSGACINCSDRAKVLHNNLEFGASAAEHHLVSIHAVVQAVGPYAISGGATEHAHVTTDSFFQIDNQTVTLSNTPNFSIETIGVNGSQVTMTGTTFAGTGATGVRFFVHKLGLIDTNTGNVNFIPGNAPGTAVGADGGYYL